MQALEDENNKLREELKIYDELGIHPTDSQLSSVGKSLVQDGGKLKPLKPPKVLSVSSTEEKKSPIPDSGRSR